MLTVLNLNQGPSALRRLNLCWQATYTITREGTNGFALMCSINQGMSSWHGLCFCLFHVTTVAFELIVGAYFNFSYFRVLGCETLFGSGFIIIWAVVGLGRHQPSIAVYEVIRQNMYAHICVYMTSRLPNTSQSVCRLPVVVTNQSQLVRTDNMCRFAACVALQHAFSFLKESQRDCEH